MSYSMAFILVQWIEDPPTWDVLPATKIVNGVCKINQICDLSYEDETSPAKILQIGKCSLFQRQYNVYVKVFF